MIQTVLGLILLTSPFLLLDKFKEKKIGFCYILSFIITLHLFTAIITQTFQVFTHPVILTINTIVFFAVITKTDFKNISQESRLLLRKIDWVLILTLIIAFICLASVHYNYSGKYNIVAPQDYQETKDMSYPYPYFSDEWYTIAFIKDSINSSSLPVKNPLSSSGSFFINLELPFHSFLSGLILRNVQNF